MSALILIIHELQKFNSGFGSEQPSWAASLERDKCPELSNVGESNVLYRHKVRNQGILFSNHRRLKR